MSDPSKSTIKEEEDEEVGEAFGYSFPENNNLLAQHHFSGLDDLEGLAETNIGLKSVKVSSSSDSVDSDISLSGLQINERIPAGKAVTTLMERENRYFESTINRQKIINVLQVQISTQKCCWMPNTSVRRAIKRSYEFAEETERSLLGPQEPSLAFCVVKQCQWFYFLLCNIVNIGVVIPSEILHRSLENMGADPSKQEFCIFITEMIHEIKTMVASENVVPSALFEEPVTSSGQSSDENMESINNLIEMLEQSLVVDSTATVELPKKNKDGSKKKQVTFKEEPLQESKTPKEEFKASTETSTQSEPCHSHDTTTLGESQMLEPPFHNPSNFSAKLIAKFEQLLNESQNLSDYPILYEGLFIPEEEVSMMGMILARFEKMQSVMDSIIYDLIVYYEHNT